MGGPLILYHALILGGAYVLVLGVSGSIAVLEFLGAVLIVGGIAIEAAILNWSAELTRKGAAAVAHGTSAEARHPSSAADVAPRVCVRCGWSGPGADRPCPRCGGSTVRRHPGAS